MTANMFELKQSSLSTDIASNISQPYPNPNSARLLNALRSLTGNDLVDGTPLEESVVPTPASPKRQMRHAPVASMQGHTTALLPKMV